jgi:hypothetical protein
METFFEFLSSRLEHLLGRASGPLNFRLVVMPMVVTIMAIRAHLRDVREGRPTVLWAFVRDRAKRQRLLRSGLKDFGKVFIVACVLDTTYQIWVLKSFIPGEMLIVAVTCAIVPYFLVRGPILRGGRLLWRKWAGRTDTQAATPPEAADNQPRSPTITDR